MCRLGERRPLLVVTPTVLDAERLSHDIGAFLGRRRRRRCSRPGTRCPSNASAPSSRPWGGACACCGACRIPRPRPGRDRGPGARPAPAPGPGRGGRRPRAWWRAATASTSTTSWPGSWPSGTGASTRSSTAASWPCGAGSSTSTPPPPSCRCASTCGATRWTGSPSSTPATSARSSDLERGRALRVPRGASHRGRAGPGRRARGHRAVGTLAVGAPGRGPGLRRHGVVAAVARRRRAGPARPGRARGARSCSSIPAASGTAPPSSTTRRRPWPGRWPSPGASCRDADASTPRTPVRRRAAEDPSERFPRLNVALRTAARALRRPGAVDGAGGRLARPPRPSWRGASSPCTATGPCWRRACRSWWRAATR